jgi:hypothetical protein
VKTPYVESYNFTVEHSFSSNLAFSAGYVGSVSRHLAVFTGPNNVAGLVTANANTQFARPFPDFGSGTYTSFNGVSTYNSLQTKLEKRFADGLYFLATYTWAHSLDDVPSPLDGGSGFRSPSIYPIIDDYSNSYFDVRHRVTLNGNYELPIGKGKKFFNGNGNIAKYALSGWSVSMSLQAQTGTPFSVTPNNATAAGASNIYASPLGDPFAAGGTAPASNPATTCAAQTRTPLNWYNPCAFGNPLGGASIPTGTVITNPLLASPYFGGGMRNNIYGPGYARVNLSVFKNFPMFRERQSLQLRADVFNLTNTPAYGQPATTNDSSAGGEITGTRFFQNNTPDARFFQLAAKFIF